MANLDLRNRSPLAEFLPDSRLRITRTYDVLHDIPMDPAKLIALVWLAWGTADEDFPGCRLIHQDVQAQGKEFPDDSTKPPYLVRVYEEISATLETLVGNPDVTVTQYNLKEVTIHWIQFSSNSATYQTPGTTAAPAPFTTYILRDQEDTDDGTLRTIKRTYCELGQLAQYEDLKFGGKVLIRTIKTLGTTAPATPTGFTLVSTSIEYVNGLKVYSYGYASASGTPGGTGGQIGLDTRYEESPDTGTTGVTITKIRWVTALTVASNPTTAPAGAVLIDVDYEDDDGYRLWTVTYAKGVGIVKSDVDTREGGKLIVYSVKALNAVPSAPSPTIGGTVVLITANSRNGSDSEDGSVVYEYTFAEGFGTVDTSIDSKYNDRLIIYKVTSLGVAPGAPAPTIGGTVVRTATDVREADGYQIFTYTFAEGLGEISRSTAYGQSIDEGTIGSTTVTIKNVVAPGAGQSPATLSGFVLVAKNLAEEDGYSEWTTTWAKGAGLVVDDKIIQVAGALVVYHRMALGGAPGTPSATIGGTVTLFDTSVRNADGYQIYDYRWAEGNGQNSIETRGEPDGALLYSVITSTAAATTPTYPGSGTAYLISLDQSPQQGYFRNVAIYKKPPATQTRRITIEWQKPGLASFTGTQLTLSPPATRTLLASMAVSYSTSQDTTTPWEVEAYASFVFNYITSPLNAAGTKATGDETIVTPSQSVSGQKGLGGYLSGATSTSGTNGLYNGILCDSWNAVLISSIPSSRPSGVTALKVDNEPYLTATDGTVLYRVTKISYTF